MNATANLYDDKAADYFSGARHDIVDALPANPLALILELGCGDGTTAALVRAAQKTCYYIGVELDPSAASRASMHCDDVLVGDIAQLDLTNYLGRIDAVIASEVLEHLIDPWAAVKKLADCLKPGGLMLASSPNISHWRVIVGLLTGQFNYTKTGVMDRSHLRWFTPRSFTALFESAGLVVMNTAPITQPAPRTELINRLTGNRLQHLFMTQIYVIARKPSPVP